MRMDIVILAGGSGERFWPLSRSSRPKQVLPLLGEQSLLATTLERARYRGSPQCWILAAERQRAAIESLGLDLSNRQILYEPMAKNTAPAMAAATELLLANARAAGESDRLALVCPSDHHIPNYDAFWSTVQLAGRVAEEERQLVTFGLEVTRPETGYGYVERGDAIPGFGETAFRVKHFHEKPDLERAEAYQASGLFSWNAGIFVFSALQMREELRQHIPELAGAMDVLARDLDKCRGSEESLAEQRDVWHRFFDAAPSISIDYGVFERSSNVAVVPASFEWSDLGGWISWAEYQQKDAQKNRHQGELLAVDAKENIVYSEDGGCVALLGVSDLIVVRVGDATLVCPKEKAQDIRQLVKEGKLDAVFSRYF